MGAYTSSEVVLRFLLLFVVVVVCLLVGFQFFLQLLIERTSAFFHIVGNNHMY